MENKRLMNLKEFTAYLGIGMTKAREICNRPCSKFTVRIGNRIYIDKVAFDKHLEECTANGVAL